MSTPAPSESINLSAAKFVAEAHRLDQLPDDDGAEIAFAGRSNAGKSSVLNTLCARKSLARTSRTPGRTQQFVIYEFAPGHRFIDLPGFGFAKVSKSKRLHWSHEIPRYLEQRQSLIGLVLVVDSRHPIKTEELQLINWCGAADLPALILLNKADKLKQKQMAQARKEAKTLVSGAAQKTAIQLFSATEKTGLDDALATIGGWFSAHPSQGAR